MLAIHGFRRIALFECALLLFFSPAWIRAASADSQTSASLEQTIDDIAAKPAFEEQMCSMLIVVEQPKIPFFGFTRDIMQISPDQFLGLRERRDEVIAILRRRLAKTTAETFALPERETSSAPPTPATLPAKPPAGESPAGRDPAPLKWDPGYVVHDAGPDGPWRSAYIYESELLILIDLNASEALEDLIAVAGRLPPEKVEKREPRSVSAGNMPGVATLSAILDLLYSERDPAVLNSEFMAAWREYLHAAGSISVEEYKAELLRPEKYNPMFPGSRARFRFNFDPWENRAVSFRKYASLEYTPARREVILGWAKDFVKRVPVDQRARAKNMAPEPFPR